MIKVEAKTQQSPETGKEFVQTAMEMHGKRDELIDEAGALLADIAASVAYPAAAGKAQHDDESIRVLAAIVAQANIHLEASAAYIRKVYAEAQGVGPN